MPKVTAAQLKSALEKFDQPTEDQRRFLQAHFKAPGHASTATMLARKARYKNHGGINLFYGRLAARIRAALSLDLPKPEEPQLRLLVDLVPPPSVTNRHYVLIMHPEFAQALKRAKWVAE